MLVKVKCVNVVIVTVLMSSSSRLVKYVNFRLVNCVNGVIVEVNEEYCSRGF